MHPIVRTIIGVAISLTASLFDALGYNMQRRDHLKNAARPLEEQRHECLRLSWHFGFFLYAGSQIIGTGFASQFLETGVVASLGGVALIFNFMFARLLLHSAIRLTQILGTVLIIIGASIIVVFGSKTANQDQEMGEALSRPLTIAYLCSLEAVIVLMFAAVKVFDSRRLKRRRSDYNIVSGHQSISSGGKNIKKSVGIAYCIISALIASQSVLLVQIFGKLLNDTAKGTSNQFANPSTYIVLVMLVGTGLLQVLFTNAALRVCDTLTTLPIGFSFYSLMAFINSLVWYNSWSLFTWWEYLLNGLGIALNVCGVFVLSIRRPIGSGYDLLATGSASEADGDDECGDDGSDSDETVDLLSDSGNTATDTKSLLYTPTASMNCRKLSNNGAQNSDPQHVSPHKRWLPSVAAAAAILSPPPALHRSVSPTAAALSSSAASSSHHTTTTSTTTNTVNSGTTIATNS